MVSAPFSNMFTRLRQLTGSGPFSVQFTIGAEWNVRQWPERHKTASFSSNPRFWSSDLNIRMVSASLPNMFTRLRELTGSGPFSVQFTIGAEWNVRQWSEHHETASFHKICDSGIMACFDYSTSAVVRVWASSPA